MTKGWAIKKTRTNEIDMRTVTDTRRGAIINWLWVHPKLYVTNAWTNLMIEEAWLAMNAGVEAIEVEIKEIS